MARKKKEDEARARAIADLTGHVFRDPLLAETALTHASARGAKPVAYQRLEFLGDRVLGLAIAKLLYAEFPAASEGELSVRLNALVNAEALADIAEQSGTAALIRAGADVRALSDRKRVNVRADVMEALIAAICLDAGPDAADAFIRRWWGARVHAAGSARRDPKTELQEWAHQVAGCSPVYATLDRTGPDHDPVFTVSVTITGREPASAAGRSKREAEQNAATAILRREGVWAVAEDA